MHSDDYISFQHAHAGAFQLWLFTRGALKAISEKPEPATSQNTRALESKPQFRCSPNIINKIPSLKEDSNLKTLGSKPKNRCNYVVHLHVIASQH